ncbi:translocation and assembly module lipoprotein TamL [Chryseolinea lacunae]|uniref:BamA/TamA family outer membrane protein n=1 Tax=Chryseolinea lacunae TaxID=2801331 RepID=A0ABS1KMI7_9BACT|nr:BamA/TamA family outer membrane protein [Chryseolinea lacunae]MBL0740685.1 BamA/TamA family outer membrane protein [Chryseolinea lacunae]
MMKLRRAILVVVAIVFVSCSGTRHLPPGETLYVGTRGLRMEKSPATGWNIREGSIKKASAYWTVWDLPNGAAFGFPSFRIVPARLIMYNWFYTEKTAGFRYWMMNNFGERPVLLSAIQPDLKTQKLINLFENYGHFGTTGSYNVHYNSKRTKAWVSYGLLIPKAYTYRVVTHRVDTTAAAMQPVVARFESQLQPGDEFNLEDIKSEKAAFWNFLQDNGHFFIQRDHVVVKADTTVGAKQMDVNVGLDDGLRPAYLTTQTIRERRLVVDTMTQQNDGDKFYYFEAGKMRRRLLDSLITVRKQTRYSLANVKTSIRNLSEMGVFGNPQVSFSVANGDSTSIDARVLMQTLDATSVSANVKGNYRATGYYGPSLGLNLTQLNVFHGAENLSVDLDGYYYFPIGVYKERVSNSTGVSLRSTLSAPLITPPFRFIHDRYSLPKKNIMLNGELNDRRDYFTMASFSVGYAFTWKSSPKMSHRLSPVEVTYSDLLNTTPLYDTLVKQNPSLQTSLTDQFILGAFYSFKYDNLATTHKRIGTYFEGKIESAGNLLYLLSRVNTGGSEGKDRRGIFGLDFSQFVELTYEFRTHYRLNNRAELAFRHVGGFGISYGNSRQLPYIRQFFVGGANSLRPINARRLGPGRYVELREGEINQVGDLKMEVNLEYRFRINSRLSGALWSDAGNVWLLREDPSRPYGQIRWNKIFNDSYLTAGVGLRVNVNVLVLRVDYGCVLYAPFFIDGYKWLWQNKLPMWGPVVGFGLPF